MKFLKEDGKIEEGVALSERQVEQRQKIEDFLHEKVCSGYHSVYGTSAKCALLDNQLIVKMNALSTAGLEQVIDGLMPKPEPEPVPEIAVVEPLTLAVNLPSAEWQDEAAKAEAALGPF